MPYEVNQDGDILYKQESPGESVVAASINAGLYNLKQRDPERYERMKQHIMEEKQTKGRCFLKLEPEQIIIICTEDTYHRYQVTKLETRDSISFLKLKALDEADKDLELRFPQNQTVSPVPIKASINVKGIG